ncbi:MAG: nuclear transport factor 2 family protein [Gemmatimonadota bacterium]
MGRILVLLAFAGGVSLFACQAAPPADEPIPNAEEDILAQERAGLDQWAAGNPQGYAHSATDDVTYFDDIAAADRIEGREAWLSYLASLPIPPHSYEITDPKVQVYGNTGILTLHYQGVGPEGEVFPGWKATSVYRYDEGVWRQVHAHWSLIKQE